MIFIDARNAIRAAAMGVALLTMGGAAVAQNYAAMDCDELWLERNQIYADAGFCFKTAQAIAEFGRNCFPPYGKLSRAEQREVARIQQAEARNYCD